MNPDPTKTNAFAFLSDLPSASSCHIVVLTKTEALAEAAAVSVRDMFFVFGYIFGFSFDFQFPALSFELSSLSFHL